VPSHQPIAAPGLSEPLAPITPAEQRVLDALCGGDGNRAIAAHLVISPRTVETHISNLLAKTGCRNRTQLLLWSLARA
jgi:DNA-binding NarL/FixJ family response regulator